MSERWAEWEAIEAAQAEAARRDAERYRGQAEPGHAPAPAPTPAAPSEGIAEGLRRLARSVIRPGDDR